MEVRLYGILAEKAGSDRIEMSASSTDELLDQVRKQIPDLDSLAFGIAVNRKLTNKRIELNGNEEVVLLPPFAGG